jgi:hypothetical protein
MMTIAARLLAKQVHVDSGCWEWVGTLNDSGYGVMRNHYKYVGAHRLSYQQFVGPIPDGMHVLHKCDNRKCINPEHLFVGTNAENVADKVAKGRQRRHHGEKNPHARLTAQDVVAIRASGERQKDLAAKYGVTRTCIYDIRVGKSWGHL